MHKGVSFVVTVGREAAAFLTNPAEDPAMRAGCLAELVQAGQAQAGVFFLKTGGQTGYQFGFGPVGLLPGQGFFRGGG